MIERLNEFIKNQGLTISEFEKSIGASDGLLRRAIKNKTDINAKWIKSISDNYPNLSMEWLIRSEGSMMRDNIHECSRENFVVNRTLEASKSLNKDLDELEKQLKSYQKKIPLVPLYAMAGQFPGEKEIMEYDCETYSVPGMKGADFLIQVKGNSMQPTYNSGDIVACKWINIKDVFFQWGRVYVLDTDQGPITKRVEPGHDAEHITIVSDNPDYKPFQLHLSQIYRIALVLGCIKLE